MFELNHIGADTIMPILLRELSPKIHTVKDANLMECYMLLNNVQAYFIEMCQAEQGFYSSHKDTYLSVLEKYGLSWVLNRGKLEAYAKDFLKEMGLEEITFTSGEVEGTRWVRSKESLMTPEDSLLIKALLKS